MVRVHSYIKTLFATPGVKRNFRVMFPNGERADLTNSDIVQESVELTESACSETVFRFGCCERSMIRFETVGVENIQGVKIRCGLEIDTTSLTAAQITTVRNAITNGNDDGVIVLAADSDLGYGYYRLPYGEYWVESCPRDHTARERRQVTAYTPDPLKMSAVEQVRLATYLPGTTTFRADTMDLAAVNMGYQTPGLFSAWSYRKDSDIYFKYTWAEIQSLATSGSVTLSSTYGGHTYAFTISGTYATMDYLEKTVGGEYNTSLKRLEMSGWDTDEAWTWMLEKLAAYSAPEPTVAAHARLPRAWVQPHIGYDKNDQYGPYDHAPLYFLPDYGCPFFIQIYAPNNLNANTFVRLMWDLSISFKIDGTTQETRTFFPLAELEATIDDLYSNLGLTNTSVDLTFAATDTQTINGTSQSAFTGCYDPVSVLEAPTELGAWQVRVDRAGAPAVIRLNNTSPTSISASDVEEIFWEDSVIQSIGKIPYECRTYKSGDYVIVSGTIQVANGGSSIYNMLDNLILKTGNWYNGDPWYISSYFVPQLKKAAFIPFEGAIHEMPWIQAGDALTLGTGDPDEPTLSTIVLYQTIRGVQLLRQEIGANGGTVFFEDNALQGRVSMIYGKGE